MKLLQSDDISVLLEIPPNFGRDLRRGTVPDVLAQVDGAYAIAVFCRDEPHRVVGARAGSPLVLGVGTGEHGGETFLASDPMALAGVTDQIVYLEEGSMFPLPQNHGRLKSRAHLARSLRAVLDAYKTHHDYRQRCIDIQGAD